MEQMLLLGCCNDYRKHPWLLLVLQLLSQQPQPTQRPRPRFPGAQTQTERRPCPCPFLAEPGPLPGRSDPRWSMPACAFRLLLLLLSGWLISDCWLLLLHCWRLYRECLVALLWKS